MIKKIILSLRFREAEAYEKIKYEQRQMDLEKSRVAKQKQTELLAKIQAATVHIPKPPPMKTLKVLRYMSLVEIKIVMKEKCKPCLMFIVNVNVGMLTFNFFLCKIILVLA